MSDVLGVVDLHAGYGATTVLRGVNVEVPEGEVVCLMGRNGAGKTTLLKALMGMLPKKGTVTFGGAEITSWKGHRIYASGMAWVPQEDSVFPGLTVREHLAIALGGKGLSRGISAAADLFPVLGDRLDQQAQTLSGGERKMLGIAQAMVVEPKLILMDEPTEGVAPVVVQELIPAIRVLTKDAAVMLVEQNIDTALALGTHAYVLEHGTIVESGPVATLHDDGTLAARLAL